MVLNFFIFCKQMFAEGRNSSTKTSFDDRTNINADDFDTSQLSAIVVSIYSNRGRFVSLTTTSVLVYETYVK